MRNKLFYKGIFLALLWAVLLFYWTPSVQAEDPISPISPDDEVGPCVEVLDNSIPLEDYCGCTRGHVYYQGQAVVGAKITLNFNGQSVTGYTYADKDDGNIFRISGEYLGAKRNSIMTLTAEYAGQSVTRFFRAWPEDEDEDFIIPSQQVDLVLDPGSWENWISGGYTSTLAALDTQTVFAGGYEGLTQIDLTTGQQTEHTLPWSETRVRDVVVDSQARIWIGGDGGVAIYENNEWATPTLPLSSPIHRLAITPDGSRAWASDNSRQGNLIFFDGTSWSQQTAIGDYVTDLVLDDEQTLWVATWQSGIVAIDDDGERETYTTEDGLAGNSIYSLLMAPQPQQEIGVSEQALWFGTRPVQGSNGTEEGVGFYDFTEEEWHVFNREDGLPTLQPVRSLAIDESGFLWAGTDAGASLLQTNMPSSHSKWNLPQEGDIKLHHLLITSNTVIAATDSGLSRLVFEPQSEEIPAPTVEGGPEDEMLALTASGVDPSIINWYWSSDVDGPLCTTANSCQLPIDRLSTGQHQLTLLVEDKDGRQSSAVEIANIEINHDNDYYVYLPTVSR